MKTPDNITIFAFNHLSYFKKLSRRRVASQVASGKESAYQCPKCRRCEFSPWVGRLPAGGNSTDFSILAWRIPWTEMTGRRISWTEEPGSLQYMGLQRAGHDWECTHTQKSNVLYLLRNLPFLCHHTWHYNFPSGIIFLCLENIFGNYFRASLLVILLIFIHLKIFLLQLIPEGYFPQTRILTWHGYLPALKYVVVLHTRLHGFSWEISSHFSCCPPVSTCWFFLGAFKSFFPFVLIFSSFIIMCVDFFQFSRSVVSDSLWPHESQHARPPCPSPTPRVHSDSCPSSQWCHPAISFSVIPSPPAPNPSQHQGLFQWVNSSHEVAKILEFQLQHQSFQWAPRTDLL